MPIFEYQCKDCGTEFEKLVRRSGEAIECPSCGHDHVAQKLSTFAAHANGRTKDSAPATPCGHQCPHPGLCGLN